jgi:pyridoxamine 5'-phosphate oxidase
MGAEPFAEPLRRHDLDPDPLEQFHRWYEAARAADAARPDAVALATATADGRPSVRYVLLKDADEQGFIFYSAYGSRKGHELEANPAAALAFYWHELGRQVRVEGSVSRQLLTESERYFYSRPYGAQLSASASRQSEVVSSRAELEAAVAELRERHGRGTVPRPEHWGGFVLSPDVYEFWQHREDRLHDRFRYRCDGTGWTIERLSP